MSSRTNALTFLAPLAPRKYLRRRVMLPLLRLLALSSSQNRLRFIHFGSWTVWRGRGSRPQMIFQSDYDGDPQEYLAAFGLQLASGMRLAFGGFEGYPGPTPTRLMIDYHARGRTRELLRYSAYPDATVRDVDAALAVRGCIESIAVLADQSDDERFAACYEELLEALAHAPEHRRLPPWTSAWRALRARDSVTGVTLLIPLTRGHTDKVVDAIRAIADEPSLLDQVGGVHFARMATVQVEGRDHLLVGAWCDGEMSAFLRRLVDKLGPRLAAISRCCTGYPGDDASGMAQWLARHHRPASLFLPSLSGETVDDVRAALALRERTLLIVTAVQGRPPHEIRRELKALWS